MAFFFPTHPLPPPLIPQLTGTNLGFFFFFFSEGPQSPHFFFFFCLRHLYGEFHIVLEGIAHRKPLIRTCTSAPRKSTGRSAVPVSSLSFPHPNFLFFFWDPLWWQETAQAGCSPLFAMARCLLLWFALYLEGVDFRLFNPALTRLLPFCARSLCPRCIENTPFRFSPFLRAAPLAFYCSPPLAQVSVQGLVEVSLPPSFLTPFGDFLHVVFFFSTKGTRAGGILQVYILALRGGSSFV